MNLGWKLAATIKGWAPDDLLDTYTTERHPIGEWVLNWTRAQVAIVRPDPHARAMAAVIRDLIATKDGTNYFVEKISGVAMKYDLGDPARWPDRYDIAFAPGSTAEEPVLRGVFEEFSGGWPVTPVMPRIPYREAMLKQR